MKKPYKVMKIIICDLIGEACLQHGEFWPYIDDIPKPECEKCDIFIEAFMKKHGLKKKKK